MLLTDAGVETLTRLRGVAEQHEREFLDPLSAQESTQLALLLSKLAQGHQLDPDVHPGQATAPSPRSPTT